MMRRLWILWSAVFWAALAGSAVPLAAQEAEEAPRTPAPVDSLVYVRPFTLSEGYRWSSVYDEPPTDTGMIVVLRVDPELVVPRNGPSPLLYAGDRLLQTLNSGYTSGYVIALVPGEDDLSETLIWFGPPAAPGRITPASIRAERERAEEAGIRPFPAERIDSVTRPLVQAMNLEDLLRGPLADLVLEYAPEEADLARKWRLPEAIAEPDSARPGAAKPEGQGP